MGFLFFLFTFSRISHRRRFRKIKALQLPVQINLDDEGIAYASANGQSKISWRAIEAWSESDRVFLIYTQPNLFYVVPKRVLVADPIAELRMLLKERIGQITQPGMQAN